MSVKHNETSTGSNKLKKIILAIMILAISGGFIILSPKYFEDRLHLDPYRSWLMHEREPSVGVISIWHIVDFKPYAGSLGAWLGSRAKDYSRKYIGIHFESNSFSAEEAAERMERGLFPDIISFSEGTIHYSDLIPLGDPNTEAAERSGSVQGILYALPYCATGKVLVFKPNGTDTSSVDELASDNASIEEFRSGKADHCVTDIRGAGDLTRAQLMGKLDYFDIIPLPDEDMAVQYIGISGTIDENKLPYARGFIEYVSSDASQKLLNELGLLSVRKGERGSSELDWLNELQKAVDPAKFRGAF